MATQRLTVATLVGESAAVATALVRTWRSGYDAAVVDRFCDTLRANGLSLPIIYFCEWVDRWLTGDLVPGPGAVDGRRYQVTCLSAEQALAWAGRCGHQFVEQEYLAARLREAAVGWGGDERLAIVIVREVLGGTTTDDEVEASLSVVPEWLSSPGGSAEQGVATDGGDRPPSGDQGPEHGRRR
jgi:hypothetical protein